MAKRAVEHLFTGDTAAYASYDSTKTVLGSLIRQKTGALATDKFAGPMPVAVARPFESSGVGCSYPHIITWNSTVDWIFLADLSTAAATRRVILYEFNKSTQVFTYVGYITLTFPSATAHTIRGLRVIRHLYTTGTASVSGTAVTGVNTFWQTNRYAVGARIGFGTTDPTLVTTWYHISAITNDNSITLVENPGTINSGPFVIEELRVCVSTTNATTTNGGLFVAKGINRDDFAPGGTAISAAISTDNIKAVYWLADAATVLNIQAGGLCVSDTKTDTSHFVYVINADAAGTMRIYKYDLRASLAGDLAAGKSALAFLYRTAQVLVTATISQTNNGRIVTPATGPGAGVPNLFCVSTTKIYRILESEIGNGSAFTANTMSEIPPGSTSTYTATSAMAQIEYSDMIDRFIVCTGSGLRHYVTQFRADAGEMDHVLFTDDKQQDQSLASANCAPHPNTAGGGYSPWVEGGIGYFIRSGATALLNLFYAIPLGAHWDYAGGATNNRLITPSLSTAGATRFYRVYVNNEKMLGSDNLGTPLEPFRLFYRTEDIADNSGVWTAVNDSGDLTGVNADNQIQFMFEFRTIGHTCLPARIYSLSVVYEDDTTDSHYQPSVGQSSIVNKYFAWRFSTAFGDVVPSLTIKLYDAVLGTLLLTDTTTAQANGTFQQSTNGGTDWTAYTTDDKGNETTYIRYTPTSFPDNIKVRALLTQT